MRTLYYEPKSCNYHQIKEIAENLLHERNVTVPPVPIKELIESDGLEVRFVQFKELGDKIAGFTDFSNRKIYVNSNDFTNRQTFTMAHEYGHWILHRSLFETSPDEYQVLLRTQQSNFDPLEQEANVFAANLLVPQFLLRPIRDIATQAELSQIFAVSSETIRHRLKYV